jgi:hypothetical protein
MDSFGFPPDDLTGAAGARPHDPADAPAEGRSGDRIARAGPRDSWPVTDRLRHLLLVTLEAARVSADLPVLGALRSRLNSWRGIGDVERGMAH